MPRKSRRRRYLDYLDKCSVMLDADLKPVIQTFRVMSTFLDGDLKDIADTCELYYNLASVLLEEEKIHTQSHRYLDGTRNRKASNESNTLKINKWLNEVMLMSDKDFLERVKISKESFDRLYELVKDHSAYLPNAKKRQTDIKLQLTVALHKLGMDEHSLSTNQFSKTSGVPVGSIYLYTQRLCKAINSSSKEVIVQQIGLSFYNNLTRSKYFIQ